MEAWSMGKPVIGGRIPAVEEVIDDGVNGFLVSDDVMELADRIILLLENQKLRQTMGAAGQQKMNSFYSWDSITQIVLTNYQKVLNRQS
ncbi:MAG: hypothetical protein A2161_02020 [Candidatus Schekmanbacteria bacterium RBG_13_48_7]|uniref:Glycosyl transferase family 1 domain-containing protein n=1 Tax=Candidatus Schekmanbacteria bacterium RBG_13_48_7 TaxID=1817878 RepID=A0A1F7RWF9_9BACT|nr:MAG: hypothetical protein A2161_02020 [Candidatus Schekmanbacteria bacterium RBG_13_48_7]